MARRRAFTLIELLVVVAITVLLIAILVPAVQKVRESARRMTCQNNLYQIGLAISLYENVHRILPPSSTSQIDFGIWSPDPQEYHLHSWATFILPYLEQENIVATDVDYDLSALADENLDAAARVITTYRCPSYAGPDHSTSELYLTISDKFAIRNYAVMGATTVGKLYENPDGTMYPRSRTRFEDVDDGLSNTIFAVETKEEEAAVWIDGGTAALTAHAYDEADAPDYSSKEVGLNRSPYFIPINNQGIDCAYGPSSNHPGQVAHLFGDRTVKMISENIDTEVYDALVTRMGDEQLRPEDF